MMQAECARCIHTPVPIIPALCRNKYTTPRLIMCIPFALDIEDRRLLWVPSANEKSLIAMPLKLRQLTPIALRQMIILYPKDFKKRRPDLCNSLPSHSYAYFVKEKLAH